MRATRSLIALSLTSLLTACGGDDAPSYSTVDDTATVEAAESLSTQSAALKSLPTGADVNLGQAPVSQLGGVIQQVAASHQSITARERADSAMGIGGYPQVVDGMNSYSFQDGKLSADMTLSTGQFAIHYVADMMIAQADMTTTIDGTFAMDYAGSGGAYDVTYDYNAAYTGVVVNGDCASAGQVKIDYDIGLAGEGLNQLPAAARAALEQQSAFSGTVIVTFGTVAGDAGAEASACAVTVTGT
jgi:hypothetical protein